MQGRMPRRPSVRLISSVVLLNLIVWVGQAAAEASDLCVRAASRAAEVSGVPFQVLLAISQTETARLTADGAKTWPWALNIRGQSYWEPNRQSALALAQATISSGETNLDIGCFQINYRWHGDKFRSVGHMLDPDAGATYAAAFLKELYVETGDWSMAAGAYHSRTPEFAQRYRRRFNQFFTAALPQADQVTRSFLRSNGAPMLPPNGRSAMGSLVPVFDGGEP